ncbi:MAG: hypothetical protein Q7R81_04365 [Candidatus Peregrinibacteria bacterium]|nr:hypothetical protein [Candidatus Peregrinibacteria bacterium]
MLDAFLFGKHLDDDETITLLVHKHWLVGVRFLVWPTISFFLSWVVLFYAPTKLVFYIVTLWSIGSLVWWIRNFFDYYLDVWIITDHGVIDLDWHGWFHRTSTRVLYSDVQGVSYEIQGFVGTVLRYGAVSVEKISTGMAITLSHVQQPRAVESLILRNMETYLHSKNLKDARHVQELLAGFVAERMQMNELTEDEVE